MLLSLYSDLVSGKTSLSASEFLAFGEMPHCKNFLAKRPPNILQRKSSSTKKFSAVRWVPFELRAVYGVRWVT